MCPRGSGGAGIGFGTYVAATDDREMRAVEHETVVTLQRATGGVEHSPRNGDMAAAGLAHQMSHVGRDGSPFVDRRAVRQMDVAHNADLLEQRQRAIHGADVGFAERFGQLLCREGALLAPNCVEDRRTGLAYGVALFAQPGGEGPELVGNVMGSRAAIASGSTRSPA